MIADDSTLPEWDEASFERHLRDKHHVGQHFVDLFFGNKILAAWAWHIEVHDTNAANWDPRPPEWDHDHPDGMYFGARAVDDVDPKLADWIDQHHEMAKRIMATPPKVTRFRRYDDGKLTYDSEDPTVPPFRPEVSGPRSVPEPSLMLADAVRWFVLGFSTTVAAIGTAALLRRRMRR